MIHAIVLPVRLVAAAFLFAMAMAKICSWPRVTEDLWRPAGLPLRLFAPGVLAVAALEAGYAVLTGAGLLRGSALILGGASLFLFLSCYGSFSIQAVGTCGCSGALARRRGHADLRRARYRLIGRNAALFGILIGAAVPTYFRTVTVRATMVSSCILALLPIACFGLALIGRTARRMVGTNARYGFASVHVRARRAYLCGLRA